MTFSKLRRNIMLLVEQEKKVWFFFSSLNVRNKTLEFKTKPNFFEGFLFKTRVIVELSITLHATVSGHLEKV